MSFSLWCDFLQKDFIQKDFVDMINEGKIKGATTNPAIFKSAFESDSYNESILHFANKKDARKIYEILAANDVKSAAFKLLTNYANGDDGFISIEIEPELFDDGVMSLKEGKHLFNIIKMPNVMIKIPASKQGLYAMGELIKRGINVNATLVFSQEQVKACLQTFSKGLKAYKKRFANAREPECVISIFVSRFDRMLDEKLKANKLETMKFGIYNATLGYYEIENFGLPNVRALFASTGVKQDGVVADYYINELAFEHSINTAPLEAINASKEIKIKQPVSKDEITEFFAKTSKIGIDYDKICQELFNDGVNAFKIAYNQTINTITEKIKEKNLKKSKK